MAAAVVIFFSCKKNSQVEPIGGTGNEKQIIGSKDNKKTNTNDGEDEIGCSREFFDPTGSHYLDVNWVEDCDFNALYGPNGGGIYTGEHGGKLSLPYLPPPLNCDICQTSNMGYYFSLLGFSGTSAPTLIDVSAMSNRLASYNAIILNIFGDPLLYGHVNVPFNIAARRAAIAAYTGTISLPTGVTMTDFLAYVDWAYSRAFGVEIIYLMDLFAPNLTFTTDPVDGIDKVNTFGVKVLKPYHNYFSFAMFDETNVVFYGDDTYYH